MITCPLPIVQFSRLDKTFANIHDFVGSGTCHSLLRRTCFSSRNSALKAFDRDEVHGSCCPSPSKPMLERLRRRYLPAARKSSSSRTSSENSSATFEREVGGLIASLLRRLEVFIAGLAGLLLLVVSGWATGNNDDGILGFNSACLMVPAGNC